MKTIDTAVIGVAQRPPGPALSELDLPAPVRAALIDYFGADVHLSPPQQWSLEQGVTRSTANYLVCAPTNSGKTLIASLRILSRAVESGARAVYVVPLKALAEEKADEFRALADHVGHHGGYAPRVVVSTGDYQLTGDFPDSPPPARGEILICTPERLEIILRNPDNLAWAKRIDTYVLDEFHLLGEPVRGGRMEVLITRLLTDCPRSSLVALSATIGGVNRIARWLGHTGMPVHVLESGFRYPPLTWAVIETPDKDAFVTARAAEVIQDPARSLLVFVYRKEDARALARRVGDLLPDPSAVGFFHAGLPLSVRCDISRRFRDRTVRILVTTTSLKLGINTPATDVVVRDTVFHGSGRLSTADVVQMLGRAGRGDAPGHATVLTGPAEGPGPYASDLRSSRVDELVPRLIPSMDSRRRVPVRSESEMDPVRGLVLDEVARQMQADARAIEAFIEHTFSAQIMGWRSCDLGRHLAFLETGKLIYKVENSEATYSATRLGRTTAFSGLSAESGMMLGGLLRAFITLSERERESLGDKPGLLSRLTDLDLLCIAVATFEVRDRLLAKPSRRQREEVIEYIEALASEEKPVLNRWRSESASDFPTRRLLSSLRLEWPTAIAGGAEAVYYQLLRTGILLHRHARGMSLAELANEYGVDEGSLENGLKYTTTWVLHCLAQICSADKCYRLDFLALRIYGLIEDLSLGSSLGALLRIKGVGRRSVEKLTEAGVITLEQVARLSKEDLGRFGIGQAQARGILQASVRRRR